MNNKLNLSIDLNTLEQDAFSASNKLLQDMPSMNTNKFNSDEILLNSITLYKNELIRSLTKVEDEIKQHIKNQRTKDND